MGCGSGGSTNNKKKVTKAAGAKPSGQIEMKKCTPSWREANFEANMHKAHRARSTWGS